MDVAVERAARVGPAVAWETLTDIERYPGSVPSYVEVEMLTPDHRGVGARWRQVRTVFGRRHAQVLEVVEWQPPRSLSTRASESGATYTTHYELHDEPPGVRITMRFEVMPTTRLASLFQRLLGRRLMAGTQAAMAADLDSLIERMESGREE